MIHRLIQVMADASLELGVRCDCAEMEQVAIIVHRIMTFRNRQFHTLNHVFGFLDDADAQTALAAVFHDLIYYQVDEGIQPEVSVLISYYVSIDKDRVRLRDDISGSDLAYHGCRLIFGFENGQELGIFSGLNEFLSALAMVGLLGEHLAGKDILAIATCIEASIPFRKPDQQGRSVGERLEQRLKSIRDSHLATLSDGEIRLMVSRAISFANKDVRDFALNDPARFLNNTWKLLPESNAALRSAGTYSIREYRIALSKMLDFFLSLQAQHVFHEYRGIPPEAAFHKMVQGAARNLQIAEAYLQAKLLAISLLEAISQLTGGDTPVALFMGDIPNHGETWDKLEDFLPTGPIPTWVDQSAQVYRLLKTGRLDEPSFDLKHSPLALFLYHQLQPAAWHRLVLLLPAFFAGQLAPRDYLAEWEKAPLQTVIQACGHMVMTRRERLEALGRSLA
jgi:hypothetical protein